MCLQSYCDKAIHLVASVKCGYWKTFKNFWIILILFLFLHFTLPFPIKMLKKTFKRNHLQRILLNNCRNTLWVWYLRCVVSRRIIPWISTWSLHVKWGAFIFLYIVAYSNNTSATSENGKEISNVELGNIIWNITTLEGFEKNKKKTNKLEL
jgi:hypothetical protein